MLNFAEQTGSGAVIVVWSFLLINVFHNIYILNTPKYERIIRRTISIEYGFFPGAEKYY